MSQQNEVAERIAATHFVKVVELSESEREDLREAMQKIGYPVHFDRPPAVVPAPGDPLAYGACTSIARGSAPVKYWRANYLEDIDPSDVLDVGCGQDKHEFSKYDPFQHPDPTPLLRTYSRVMCNYVLNVQPSDHLITQIAAMLRLLCEPTGLVLISVRADLRESVTTSRSFQVIKSNEDWTQLLAPFFEVESVGTSSRSWYGFKCTPRAAAVVE